MPGSPGHFLLFHPSPVGIGLVYIELDFTRKCCRVSKGGVDLRGRNVKILCNPLCALPAANLLDHPVNPDPCSLHVSHTAPSGFAQLDLGIVTAAHSLINESRSKVSRLVAQLCCQPLQSPAYPDRNT